MLRYDEALRPSLHKTSFQISLFATPQVRRPFGAPLLMRVPRVRSDGSKAHPGGNCDLLRAMAWSIGIIAKRIAPTRISRFQGPTSDSLLMPRHTPSTKIS
jgi:hypothetical protein